MAHTLETVSLCDKCDKISVLPDPAVMDSIVAVLRTGHQLSSPQAAIDSKIAEMSLTLESYEQELWRLDAAWNKIREARNVVAYSLRAYSSVSAPIRRMPSEILLHIFEFVCAQADELFPTDMALYVGPAILASVCKVWRLICESSSRLWRRLAALSTPWYTVNWDWVRPGDYEPRLKRELPVLSTTGSSPCTRLVLSSIRLASTARSVVEVMPDFTHVETLSIKLAPGYQYPPLALDVPNVRHLYVDEGSHVGRVVVKPRSLQTLWLDGFSSFQGVINILAAFPGRIDLTLHNPSFRRHPVRAPGSAEIECNVKTLHIMDWGNILAPQLILEDLTFPHLTSLTFTGPLLYDDDREYMDDMIMLVRIICAVSEKCPFLNELQLHELCISASDLLDVFYHFPRLTSLSIIEPSRLYPWHSTFKASLVNELRHGLMLPELTDLEMVWSAEWGVDEEAIMDMVTARADKLQNVVVGRRNGHELKTETKEMVNAIREMGVNVTYW